MHRHVDSIMNDPLGLEGDDYASFLDHGKGKNARDALEKEAMEFADLFLSPIGIRVMEHLKRKTVDMPTWNYNIDPKLAHIQGFAREGQNSIYHYINKMTQKGLMLKEEQSSKNSNNEHQVDL